MDREHELNLKILALAEEVRALTLQVEELRERVRSAEHQLAGLESS